jgi:hypothetical protein
MFVLIDIGLMSVNDETRGRFSYEPHRSVALKEHNVWGWVISWWAISENPWDVNDSEDLLLDKDGDDSSDLNFSGRHRFWWVGSRGRNTSPFGK